jgi:hypothetical protein
MNNQLMAGEKLNTSNRYGKYSFSHACHKLENTKGAHSQSFGAYYGSQMVPLHITNGAFDIDLGPMICPQLHGCMDRQINRGAK